ncbi:MAG TPA: hypothetical protein VG052_10490 [Puia sp.]|jgi:hypothetical protein|nr:hypothetical protein [Puia sp.]
MTTTSLLSGLLLVIILVLIIVVVRIRKKRLALADRQEPDNSPGLTGQMVVEALENLDYFKYTDPTQLDLLKKEIGEAYDQHKVLSTINSLKSPFEPYCRRLYFCDGEILFESGGIVEYLTDVTSTFEKLGIPLVWSDEYFRMDAKEHTIVVNGKKYIAFKGIPRDTSAWDRATKNFVELLNDQLLLHHSDERVYPISGRNDGRIVFLTRPQYDFIYRHFDKKERPMKLALWRKENAG